MLSRRLTAFACAGALALTPVLTAVPAQAAPAATVKVTVKTSADRVKVGAKVKLSGKVSGRSTRAKVVLQRKAGARWVKVASTKVKKSKRYAFRTTVRPGATTYRVKMVRTAKLRTSWSRAVTVRGLRQPGSTPGTTPGTPGTTPGTTPADPGAGQVSAEVQRILDETNAFRAENGKAPLKLDTAMSKVATSWSRHMGETNTFEHNPDYSRQIPAGWTRAAENIAAGYAVDAVVTGWINSPGHRANLLGDFTHIGIGHVVVPGSEYTRYSTQNFANYSKR